MRDASVASAAVSPPRSLWGSQKGTVALARHAGDCAKRREFPRSNPMASLLLVLKGARYMPKQKCRVGKGAPCSNCLHRQQNGYDHRIGHCRPPARPPSCTEKRCGESVEPVWTLGTPADIHHSCLTVQESTSSAEGGAGVMPVEAIRSRKCRRCESHRNGFLSHHRLLRWPTP